MQAEPAVSIGLDLGTSGLKAVAIDSVGRAIARASRSYPTKRPEPDAAEQDPFDWLTAVDDALATIAQSVPPSRWGAVGLSAMLPTLVAANAAGKPVHPAITWEDGRAEPQAEAFVTRFGAERLLQDTGQHLDGRYLVPMLARLQSRGVKPSWMLGAKDWLVWQLTGTPLSDPSTAAGSGCWQLSTAQGPGRWDEELLDFVNGDGTLRVPDVVASSHAVPLAPHVAQRWGCPAETQLVVGAADSVLGAYGTGVRSPGTIACIAGTSTVFLGITDQPFSSAAEHALITPTADDRWALETDLVATGSAFAWLARLTGATDVASLLSTAEAAELDAAPLVLPYFGPGEQGALWDPSLTGLLHGVTLRTGPAELALGLLAGVVLESARCVSVLAGDDGQIVASGSGATAPYLRRLADATGRTVRAYTGEHDHSAVGAALLAGRSTLDFSDDDTPEPQLVFEPVAAEHERWAQRFARHEATRIAMGGTIPAADTRH